jgi:hypothetical protein
MEGRRDRAGNQVFNWRNPLSDGLLGNHEEPMMKFNLSKRSNAFAVPNIYFFFGPV